MEMDMSSDCWSLVAVVRECARKCKPKSPPTHHSRYTNPPVTANGTDPIGLFLEGGYQFLPHEVHASNIGSSVDELENLYKPFLLDHSAFPYPNSPAYIDSNNKVGLKGKEQLFATENRQDHRLQPADQFSERRPRVVNNKKSGVSCAAQQCIHKKKKIEDKRVCKLNLEELSNDKWAWRKYGQKPIKGSPYPRNYYRCSSSKGCTARKQVERSPLDPNIYVVTYSGQHYHPRPPTRIPNTTTTRVIRVSPPTPPEDRPPNTPMNTIQDDQDNEIDMAAAKMVENDNVEDEYEVSLIPNSMADMELLMGMEQLMTTKRGMFGYDPIDRNAGLGIGIQEMELDSPNINAFAMPVAHESPNAWGRNIWDNAAVI